MLMNSNEYLSIVESIKKEIRTAQYRATVRVNRELLMLYHSIGDIINKHKTWGNKFIETFLRRALSSLRGESRKFQATGM